MRGSLLGSLERRKSTRPSSGFDETEAGKLTVAVCAARGDAQRQKSRAESRETWRIAAV
jgi:hypothetical protein